MKSDRSNVAYRCGDTLSLVPAGFGVGFVPEWAKELPNRGFGAGSGGMAFSL
jgi:hypothetical protein